MFILAAIVKSWTRTYGKVNLIHVKGLNPDELTATYQLLQIGAIIEDNCTIINAIVCDKSIVRHGSTISSGCILSFGVEVGPGVTLNENTRLTTVGDKKSNGVGVWTCENGKAMYSL